MTVITRKTLARQAAAGWDRQYHPRTRSPAQAAISDALRRLGPDPDPDAVNHVIGNTSWTMVPCCDECGEDGHDAVIEVGQEPDHESATARLCAKCLTAATALLLLPSP